MSERSQLFIGERGMLYTGGRGAPTPAREKFKDYPMPPETSALAATTSNGSGRAREGPAPGSNFLYQAGSRSRTTGQRGLPGREEARLDYVNLRARNARKPTSSSGVRTGKAGGILG